MKGYVNDHLHSQFQGRKLRYCLEQPLSLDQQIVSPMCLNAALRKIEIMRYVIVYVVASKAG